MEYRPQTILGAMQVLIILVGNWFVRSAVKGLENVLVPDLSPDPLRFLRPLEIYGWLLVTIPFAWMILSILGERSNLWWASNPLTVLSGMAVLAGLMVLFGWALYSASSMASGHSV